MRTIVIVVTGLTFSNLFMTFAWYGHLKNMKGNHWIIAALHQLFMGRVVYGGGCLFYVQAIIISQ